MKIVVTGATGLIGSALVKELIKNPKNHVVVLGRTKEKIESVFKEDLYQENFDYACADFTSFFDFKTLISRKFQEPVDAIYHAAGPIASDIIKFSPLSVITPNINGLQIICNYIVKTNKDCKLIVFSSATVYGNITNSDIFVNEKETSVAESLDGLNCAYSESKRMAEIITKSYVAQYGLKAVIVRPSYVYGMTNFNPNTAFYSFIDKIRKNENIVLNQSGLGRRDNVFIEDIVNGLLICLEKGICGETYNISSGGDGNNFVAIDEIAEEMVSIAREKYNKSIEVVYKEDKNIPRLPGIKLDNAKLKGIGWNVINTLQKGLEKTLEFYLGK